MRSWQSRIQRIGLQIAQHLLSHQPKNALVLSGAVWRSRNRPESEPFAIVSNQVAGRVERSRRKTKPERRRCALHVVPLIAAVVAYLKLTESGQLSLRAGAPAVDAIL